MNRNASSTRYLENMMCSIESIILSFCILAANSVSRLHDFVNETVFGKEGDRLYFGVM